MKKRIFFLNETRLGIYRKYLNYAGWFYLGIAELGEWDEKMDVLVTGGDRHDR